MRGDSPCPQCGQFFFGDLLANEGCSERSLVPGEVPVSEPLAPRGMGSGIGDLLPSGRKLSDTAVQRLEAELSANHHLGRTRLLDGSQAAPLCRY
jgi:hypothetical protein